MAQPLNDLSIVGTEALPIALGANGSATDVWTWTHNKGVKAATIDVIDAVTRQLIAPNQIAPGVTLVGRTVAVNTNSTTVIAIQNMSTLTPTNVMLRITWEDLSIQLGKPEVAAVGTLS